MATIAQHNQQRHNGFFAKADYIVGIVVDGAFYCSGCVGTVDAETTQPVFVTDDYKDLTCDDCMMVAFPTEECKWCYSPGTHAVWTPRHGWHDLCARHHDELAREVRSNLIESRTKLGTEQEA